MTRAAQLAGLGSLEGSAPAYACRAWVNFNGTGTVAIRASGNVSSITDNGTGNYTVNCASELPDTNYAVIVSKGQYENDVISDLHRSASATTYRTTTATRIVSGINYSGGTVAEDENSLYVAIFR